MTNFDLRGLSLKKYYGKPIGDRTLIFAPILLICNDVYGKKYIGPSDFVHIGSRGGGGNFFFPREISKNRDFFLEGHIPPINLYMNLKNCPKCIYTTRAFHRQVKL